MGRILFYVIFGYVFIVAFFFVFQRYIQYQPDRNYPGKPAEHGLPPVQEVRFRTEDGVVLYAWFAAPRETGGKVVVFFHGNAGHVAHRAIKARYFLEKGYGIMFVEYRGYGGNPGRPSEKGLYADARAALSYLEERGYKLSDIVFYGESIGSGVAVEMARHAAPAAMVLEAPFTNVADVAARFYPFLPVRLMLHDRFDNESKIGDIKTPLLIVHGDEDGVIPHGMSKVLYDKAQHPKEYVTINGGGHNDLYEHHAGHIVMDWLEKNANVAAPTFFD